MVIMRLLSQRGHTVGVAAPRDFIGLDSFETQKTRKRGGNKGFFAALLALIPRRLLAQGVFQNIPFVTHNLWHGFIMSGPHS